MNTNTQKREKPSKDKGHSLDIINVWPTIQGEGPLIGTPSVFIRLAGCNLNCPLCDTNYTKNRKVSPILELVQKCASFDAKLVVLTGGEPLRQNIGPFCRLLLNAGKDVQIETNGTLFNKEIPKEVRIVCSPKTSTINSMMRQRADAFKYVVEKEWTNDQDGLPTRVLGNELSIARPPERFPRKEIYIQPMDVQDPEVNHQNAQYAISVCMRFGYRFCPQVHKMFGME